MIRMMRPDIPTFGSNNDRLNSSGRGYDAKWKAAAAKFKRARPYCLGCEAAFNRKVAAEVVDHVQPHRGDREVFWNVSMWQPSCRWHHDVVKKKLEHLFYHGTIGADALWLDSGAAVAISKRRPGG